MWEMSVYLALRRASLVLLLGFSVSACSVKQPSVKASCESRISTVYSGPAERSYCTAVIDYPNDSSYTITGKAVYEARTLGTGAVNGQRGLVSVAIGANAKNIRYAEIEVLDSAGNRVQCGQTGADGTFSLKVPQTTDSYTIRVNSRSAKLDSFSTPLLNPVVQASVLNCPEENGVYSITAKVTPSVNTNVGTITAEYNNTVIGAAFNIFDQFVEANEFLRTNAGNCAANGCTNFTVAPKVTAYWEKGFNPNSYFGETEDGVSFYLPGYSRMFIMGGVDGDVDSSDTDHWDNAIILHEYGHFLEDVYSTSDSPGGAHTGTGQIDPRLAWSEGWGNFIQAAIRGVACYTDTEGNVDGEGRYIFNVPLQTWLLGCADSSVNPNFDVATNLGEGIFREFTISRFLYDVYDTDADDNVNNAFHELWSVLTSATGFNNPAENFRSAGLLNELQQLLPVHTNWSTLRSTHMMGSGREEYALPVAIDTSSPTTMCPSSYDRSFYMAPYGTSAIANLLGRNDFYFYKHPGGRLTLKLIYENYQNIGVKPDVDLILYNSRARLFRNDRADEMARAESSPIDTNPANPETETITLANLAAGDYLIHVKVWGANGSAVNSGSPFIYDLLVNTDQFPSSTYPSGVYLCP